MVRVRIAMIRNRVMVMVGSGSQLAGCKLCVEPDFRHHQSVHDNYNLKSHKYVQWRRLHRAWGGARVPPLLQMAGHGEVPVP